MELDVVAARISEAERVRRLQYGLCAYCGGEGHFKRDCPARPKQKTVNFSPSVNDSSLKSLSSSIPSSFNSKNG